MALDIGTCNCHKLFFKKNFPNVYSAADQDNKQNLAIENYVGPFIYLGLKMIRVF